MLNVDVEKLNKDLKEENARKKKALADQNVVMQVD
jgi:hypothetical protein